MPVIATSMTNPAAVDDTPTIHEGTRSGITA
jgi:hypothetical protein